MDIDAEAIGWQGYYQVDRYRTRDDEWADESLANAIGCDPADLVRAGIGTAFVVVHGVRSSDPDDASLADIDTWFAHGDPWHVLIGVGNARVVVGSVDLFEGGYIGPPSLTCVRPKWLARPHIDLAELWDLTTKARNVSRRSIRRCLLCDSPRYCSGCRCDGAALGIIYD